MDIRELRRWIGDLSQVASARSVRLMDGDEDGVRALDVRTMGGLHAMVIADRGLDIGPAWFAGQPISWQSPTGIVHPAYDRRAAWSQTFPGGLLMTAGLHNVGPACVDDAREYRQHGRASVLPARRVASVVRDDSGLVLEVSGEVRDASAFGPDLLLRRTLRFPVGHPRIEIHDDVENVGYEPAPLFILYHFNLGYPVVDEHARFLAPPSDVLPRDERSAAELDACSSFAAPRPGFEEQVFEHRFRQPTSEWVTVGVANEGYAATGGLGVAIRYRPDQLPRFWQWRLLSTGAYVTGLEPANCGVSGRTEERQSASVDILQPGEHRAFDLEVRASQGPSVADELLAATD